MATTEESRVIGKHTYHVGDQVIYTYSPHGKPWNNEKILTVEKFTPKRMKLTGGVQVDLEGNIYDSKAYSGDIKPSILKRLRHTMNGRHPSWKLSPR